MAVLSLGKRSAVVRKVRLVVFAGLCAALVAFAAAAMAGTPAGQGAQKAGLGPASGGMTNCQQSSGSDGWAILNDPGKVGAVRFTNGEVHLVGGTPNTTYAIFLGMPNGNGNMCMMTGDTLTTNGVGIGNGHIEVMPAVTGQVFVALFAGMQEKFATSQVPLQ
jgi:hypothetical protein